MIIVKIAILLMVLTIIVARFGRIYFRSHLLEYRKFNIGQGKTWMYIYSFVLLCVVVFDVIGVIASTVYLLFFH